MNNLHTVKEAIVTVEKKLLLLVVLHFGSISSQTRT